MRVPCGHPVLWAALPVSLALLTLGSPQSAQSQVVDTVSAQAQEAPDSLATDEDTTPGLRGVSPGGAFLRSVLIPGWGHAAAGSYTRGGFYLVGQGMTSWMLFKTNARLDQARRQTLVAEREAEARIVAGGTTDPDSISALLDQDEAVLGARDLEGLRSQQWEDWFALGIFLVLLGGADAFVSTHLADFPLPLTVETGAEGIVEIGVSVPVGGRPSKRK